MAWYDLAVMYIVAAVIFLTACYGMARLLWHIMAAGLFLGG